MSRKLTYEEVKKTFEDGGCELLEERYRDCDTPMLYKCSCGETARISLWCFKQGQRCKQCGIKKRSDSTRFNYEEVKKTFENQGCELLETEYKGSGIPMSYICSCGEKSKIALSHFKSGRRCKKCGITKTADSGRLSYEEVKKTFEDQGCELLEDTYVNNSTPMLYRCECGEPAKISLSHFKEGKRCNKCKGKKISEFFRLDFEEVKKIFEDASCELLETEYKNNSKWLSFKCHCGNVTKKTLAKFKKNPHCQDCGLKLRIEKTSGENSCRWNPNREEVETRRKYSMMASGLVIRVLKLTNTNKTAKSEELLGYTRRQLREHIENHKNMKDITGDFHIDHIYPVAAFIRLGIFDLKLINSLDNLQPLSPEDNLSKNDKYDRDKFEKWLYYKQLENRQSE